MKKILTLVAALSLVASLAVGGSIAYLQDTDEKVNVMTLGNVDIDQIEKEWNDTETELQDFTQAKPLYPYVGTLGWENKEVDGGAYRRFTMNNVVDKYVTVKNTGRSDAYVRTIIALEMGDYEYNEFNMVGISNNAANGTEFQFPGAWKWTHDFAAEIDGKKYNIMVAVHENSLAAGKETIPSLLQVYLSKDAGNEEVERLDGNKNGTYDILTLSQAVQTAGFANADTALDTAFGDVTAENVAKWFEGTQIPTTISGAAELTNVLANGGSVVLSGDVKTEESTTIEEGVEADIYLQGNTLTTGSIYSEGTTTIGNGTIDGAAYVQNNGGNMTVTDTIVNAGTPTDYAGITTGKDAATTLNNVEITSGGGGVAAAGGAKVEFNGGKVYIDSASTSGRYIFYAEGEGSEITINDGDFGWDKNDNQKRAYIYAGAGTTVYVKGGTFGKASTRGDYAAGIMGTGNVIITGGTFGFNPSDWVAAGYQAVQNGDTWTVSAN